MNYKFSIVFVSFLIAIINPIFSQAHKPTIAVLDFEGRGVPQNEVLTLSDRLSSELNNTNAVTLVERKRMNLIMEEQGLQQSGCISDECVAEVGKLLGVQLMVSGSVNKIGKTFTIEAKVFSVETGAFLRTVSKTHKGEIDDLLAIMEVMAWELVGLDQKPIETVAVLDFEGRGISVNEAATLTDRFSSELGATGAVLLVARNEMNEILEEQGIGQGSECASIECAAEIGAMLGVQNIINGSVGKLGRTYTIDARMITVSTGATIKTVSESYQGEIDGLITVIEIMAWEILNLNPPNSLLSMGQMTKGQPIPITKTKRGALTRSLFIPGWGQIYSGKKKWGFTWMLAEAAMVGMIYKSTIDYSDAELNFNKYQALYNQTTDTDLIAEYRLKKSRYHDDMEAANSQILIFAGSAGGIWLFNIIHAYISGPDSQSSVVNLSKIIQVAYNSEIKQAQLKWVIAID